MSSDKKITKPKKPHTQKKRANLQFSKYDPEIVAKIRYAITMPKTKDGTGIKNRCIPFGKLTDDQLFLMYQMRQEGREYKEIVKIIHGKWGALPSNTERTLLAGISQLFLTLDHKITDASESDILAARETELIKDVNSLEAKKRTLENNIKMKYEPLLDLVFLAETQKERILQWRECERTADAPIKELDTMVGSMRDTVATYVKAGEALKIFGERSETNSILGAINVHIKQTINNPPAVVSTVAGFMKGIEDLALPMIEASDGSFVTIDNEKNEEKLKN